MAGVLNRWWLALACLLAAVLFSPTARAEGRRVALVIGIGAYRSEPALANTVGDARLIADTLRGTGFDVALETDLSKDGLVRSLRDFGRRLEAAGPDAVAVLYYAGHGIQDDKGVNYLVGADADLRSQVDLPLGAMALDAALATLEAAKPALTFVILDACRNNPLPASDRRSAKRGLAVEAERRGLLIAFSTEPGKTAMDGPPGGHSPFAAALARGLDTAGLEVTQLFKLVAKTVLDDTHEEQFPWVTQRLTEDFYFRPDTSAPTLNTPAPAALPAAAPKANTISEADAGEIAYGQAVMDNTTEGYEGWLRRFPTHERKSSVLALLRRLREEELWRRAEGAASPADAERGFGTLLIAFPDGVYAEKARARLAALHAAPQAPDVRAVPPPVEVRPPPPAGPEVRRFTDTDAPGNDRGGYIRDVGAVSDCETLCVRDHGCAGYTYNVRRRVCILKSAMGSLVASPEPAVTGVVQGRAATVPAPRPAAPARFRTFEDMDAPHNDLVGFVRGVSFADCETICLSTPACMGYTYNRQRAVCIPKSRIGRLVPSPEAAVTGVRQGIP